MASAKSAHPARAATDGRRSDCVDMGLPFFLELLGGGRAFGSASFSVLAGNTPCPWPSFTARLYRTPRRAHAAPHRARARSLHRLAALLKPAESACGKKAGKQFRTRFIDVQSVESAARAGTRGWRSVVVVADC